MRSVVTRRAGQSMHAPIQRCSNFGSASGANNTPITAPTKVAAHIHADEEEQQQQKTRRPSRAPDAMNKRTALIGPLRAANMNRT